MMVALLLFVVLAPAIGPESMSPLGSVEKALALSAQAREALQRKDYLQAGRLGAAAAALPDSPEAMGTEYNAACAFALGGDTDAALRSLTTAVQRGFPHGDLMERDTDLEALRTHPLWPALVERAAQEGIRIQSIAPFRVARPAPNGLVLGFGMIAERDVEPAVQRLARLLR